MIKADVEFQTWIERCCVRMLPATTARLPPMQDPTIGPT